MGDVGRMLFMYLFGDKVAVVTMVTSFEEVSSKLSSSSVERFVGRTNNNTS